MAVSSAFVQLLPSIRGFHRDAASDINAKRLTANVGLIPELKQSIVDKEIRDKTKAANATVKMTPDLDATAGQRQADQAARKMERTIKMPVVLDDVFAQKSLLALQKRLMSKDITIGVNIATARAVASLMVINGVIGRVSRSLLKMAATATIAFGALALLSAASAGIGGLAAALGAASAALLVLPGLAAVGAAAIGTLVIGMQGVGDTMSAIASGDAKKFGEALANLAPPARGLFQAIWDVREQFTELRKSVQGALFQNLAEPFTNLANAVLPVLKVGLTGIAEAFNGLIRGVMEFYTRASVVADLGILFSASATLVRNWGAAFIPILAILQDIGTVGAQVLASMSASLVGTTQRWADFIRQARETGQLETWIRNAFTVLGDMVATLVNLGGIFYTVFSAASVSGAGLFATLRGITGELLAMLRSVEGQAMLTGFFSTLRATVDAAMPGLRAIGGALVNMVAQVGPALPAVGAAFSALAVALKPVLDGLGWLVGLILPPLAGLLQFLAPTLGLLVAGLASAAPVVLALVAAWKIWNAVLAFQNFLLATNPIVLVILAIAALVGMVIYAYHNFAWFRDIVQAAWAVIVMGAQWVWGVLTAVWTGIVAAVQWAGTVLSGIFLWISGLVTTVGGWFVWLWQAVVVPAWTAIVGVISWAWNTIMWPVLQAIGAMLAFLGVVIFTLFVAPFVIAWNILSAAALWAWHTILRPTFAALGAFASWVWTAILAPTFTAIRVAFAAVAFGISWAWTNILRPAWNAVASAATWLWNTVLSVVFGLIRWGWENLVNGVRFLWENVLRPAWNAVAMAARWLWETVLAPVFGLIRWGWQMMVTGIRVLYDTVLKPCWDALVAAIRFVWESVLRPIFQGIGNAWRSTMEGIRHVYHSVVETTFNALKGAVHAVGSAFDSAVRWIGDVWNRIKGILARPVNFLIDAVYMGGVKKTWDMIAGWLKIPGLPPIGRIPENKRGGIIGGGYSPGRDNMLSWVGSGESVMRPEWTRAVGPGYVDAANQAARSGGIPGVQDFLTGANDGPIRRTRKRPTMEPYGGVPVPAFAGGGQTWPRLWDIVRKQFPDISLTSSYRPGDPGYHGRGQAIDVGYGNWSRHGQVAAWIANTFPGSTELISAQFRGGLGIKNGRPLNYGPGTTAAHQNHVHWAMAGEPVPGGGGGGVFDILGMVIEWFKNTAMKPVTDTVGQFLGKFGDNGFVQGMTKIPGQAVDHGVNWLRGLGDRLWDIATNALGSLFGGGGGGGAGVERWRGVALQALRMTGQPLGMVDVLLRRMNQESGGNPNAINLWDSNAKKGTPSIGLLQTIQPTFDAYKMPGFNNIRAPLDNILASIRYTIARYGSLPAGYNRAGGYDSGGWLPPGLSMTYNGTGRPEAILTADQWDSVRDLAERSGGTNIYVDAPTNASPERIAAAVDRRLAMSGRI